MERRWPASVSRRTTLHQERECRAWAQLGRREVKVSSSRRHRTWLSAIFPVRPRVGLLKSGQSGPAVMVGNMERADGMPSLGRARLLLCCSLGRRFVESILRRIVDGSHRTIAMPFWSICGRTVQDEWRAQAPHRRSPHYSSKCILSISAKEASHAFCNSFCILPLLLYSPLLAAQLERSKPGCPAFPLHTASPFS